MSYGRSSNTAFLQKICKISSSDSVDFCKASRGEGDFVVKVGTTEIRYGRKKKEGHKSNLGAQCRRRRKKKKK